MKMNNVERHEAICEELNALYERKNHDYGDSFHLSFLEEGMAMARIRLDDKLNRFKTLTKKPDAQQVRGESIRDTLLDLANYAIMTVMELEGENGKEAKEQKESTVWKLACNGHIVTLVRQGGVLKLESPYCTVCDACCYVNVDTDKEPCENCVHNCGNKECFLLNDALVLTEVTNER